MYEYVIVFVHFRCLSGFYALNTALPQMHAIIQFKKEKNNFNDDDGTKLCWV